MVVLIGFLGLAVDVGFMFMKKNQLQNVADAAALSCVINNSAPPYACGDGVTQKTNINVTTNTYIATVNPDGYTIKATYPYVAQPPYASPSVSICTNEAKLCAKAVVTTTFNPFFMGALGFSPIEMYATAVANKSTVIAPSCFVALSDLQNNGSKSTLAANGCNISAGNISKDSGGGPITSTTSTGGTGAINIYNNNGADVQSLCGGCSPGAGGIGQITNISGALTDPVGPPDISGVSPICQDTANGYPKLVSGIMTAVNGTYCNKLSLTANTVFGNGLYVLKNGLADNGKNMSNTCSGTAGVTFYITAGSWDATGNNTLCAPTNCPPQSNGLLIYQNPSDTNEIKLQGGSTSVYTGILDFSGAILTLGGTPSGFTVNGSFIAKQIIKNGNNTMTVNVAPNSCNNAYLSGKNPFVLLQ